MPTFITIGYGNQAGYDQTAGEVRDAAHRHDAWLQAQGAIMGVAGSPVQVRNHDDAGVVAAGGAFMESDLPIAGFALIEAADIQEAMALVAGTPCAVAHGVVEVWPLQTA